MLEPLRLPRLWSYGRAAVVLRRTPPPQRYCGRSGARTARPVVGHFQTVGMASQLHTKALSGVGRYTYTPSTVPPRDALDDEVWPEQWDALSEEWAAYQSARDRKTRRRPSEQRPNATSSTRPRRHNATGGRTKTRAPRR
jgi:hypothetical protein